MHKNTFQPVVIVEHVLCSVAMVHVPVQYEHSPHTVVFLCVAGRDGHVVEYTEAHAECMLCVMAWRTHNRYSTLTLWGTGTKALQCVVICHISTGTQYHYLWKMGWE